MRSTATGVQTCTSKSPRLAASENAILGTGGAWRGASWRWRRSSWRCQQITAPAIASSGQPWLPACCPSCWPSWTGARTPPLVTLARRRYALRLICQIAVQSVGIHSLSCLMHSHLHGLEPTAYGNIVRQTLWVVAAIAAPVASCRG